MPVSGAEASWCPGQAPNKNDQPWPVNHFFPFFPFLNRKHSNRIEIYDFFSLPHPRCPRYDSPIHWSTASHNRRAAPHRDTGPAETPLLVHICGATQRAGTDLAQLRHKAVRCAREAAEGFQPPGCCGRRPFGPWFTGHVISDRTLTAAAEASSLGRLAIDLRNQRI